MEKTWMVKFVVLILVTIMLFTTRTNWNKYLTTIRPQHYGLTHSFETAIRFNLSDEFLNTARQTNLSDDSELWNIVQSSPWLFPKSRSLFSYLGLHNDLDGLLQIMSRGTRKIMILGFNSHWQSMIENNIFTLVRFARASNYIVLAPDQITLLVCIELNLPCYNASRYFEDARGNVSINREGLFLDPYFLALVWYGLPLYLDILRKGFTIMKSDSDISFASKEIWAAMENMVNETKADLVFMREHPVNTGHFYASPNDRVKAFFEEWIASRAFLPKLNEQLALSSLMNKTYMLCQSEQLCSYVKNIPMKSNMSRSLFNATTQGKMAAVTTYPSAFSEFGGICPPNITINPCKPQTLYVHPICMTSSKLKIEKLKALGFWLLTEPCSESAFEISINQYTKKSVKIVRCIPLPRLWPKIEESFIKC
ncbi:unnamed protein product [Adineta ricciae]|uniref:Nucleotide-diphospho-sugar transferase domain-containing protein n=1 Tax=Adineta ricciae TaxID=249248 RepID=A0A815WQA7_ADIRI|nr:unnamed protein product [Adineta ricciae]CAF1626377.1 unnamed protein product [Adineta ricciae]